jgi:peptidoglycan/LPS O-acetylase OafA/YrhL
MVRILSPIVRPALPFLVYAGGLSYALYLVHYPLLQIFNATNIFPPIVKILAVVVLAFGAAHLLDYKFQPWIRSRLRRTRRAGELTTGPQRNEAA